MSEKIGDLNGWELAENDLRGEKRCLFVRLGLRIECN